MRDRRGYTLVELMIVVCILGILAAVATPKLQGARAHARAAEVVGAMRAVRIAATMYLDSANAWPPDAASGVSPTDLVGYLPRGGDGIFSGNGWTMQWRVVSVMIDGVATSEPTMETRVTDPLLCLPLGTLLGGASSTVTISCDASGGRVTQLVER